MADRIPPARTRQSNNRSLIAAVLAVFVLAVLGIALWGGFETADVEAVPDEAAIPAPGEGSIVNGPTGATEPPAPVTEDVAPSNNPVATE